MLKLLKFANQLRGKMESRAFDRATAEPEKTQRQVLLNFLQKNANSFFGKLHNFNQIRNEDDFRRQVPVRDYEDFRPFINRIVNGEKQILTAENPFMLTMTSGTTGEPKYIPVTRESQAHNSSLMRQWLYRAEVNHAGLLSQASVGIVSRAIEGCTDSGLPYGSASGLIYKNIPWFIRRAYAIPYLVSEIEDYDERYFILARFALAGRVSFIATPNPSTLLRFAQVCADNQEKLIQTIHDGTLGIRHEKLSELLKPNPQRARVLAQIVTEKGFLQLADSFGDLRLIGCWLGGSVGAQANKLAEFFGDVPLRDLGFMASEGHFTVPFENETSSGILALRQNYYEFIPEDDRQICLSAHELEIGKRYSILLTTAAGLYRYRLNDIVEVTGFYGRTPLLSFIRKAGEMANITGEKMHANHFLEAFDAVRRKFDLKIEHFCAAPDFNLSRYEIFLELRDDFPPLELLAEIDKALQRVNIEYEQKRKSSRLALPCINLMKRGWADSKFRRHIADGKRDTQYKPQILYSEEVEKDSPFIVQTIEAEVSRFAMVGVKGRNASVNERVPTLSAQIASFKHAS